MTQLPMWRRKRDVTRLTAWTTRRDATGSHTKKWEPPIKTRHNQRCHTEHMFHVWLEREKAVRWTPFTPFPTTLSSPFSFLPSIRRADDGESQILPFCPDLRALIWLVSVWGADTGTSWQHFVVDVGRWHDEKKSLLPCCSSSDIFF